MSWDACIIQLQIQVQLQRLPTSINISKERGLNKYCRIDMKVVHLHDVCECIVQIDKSIKWWGCEIVLMYF